jgi:hypothetical protein
MLRSQLIITLLFFIGTANLAVAFTNHNRHIICTASYNKGNSNNNNSSSRKSSSQLNLYNSVEEAIAEAQRNLCSGEKSSVVCIQSIHAFT